MPKKSSQILTNTEVLCYAIRSACSDWKDIENKAKAAEAIDPAFAAEIRQTFPAREKLDALRDLYKLETGTEYPIE